MRTPNFRGRRTGKSQPQPLPHGQPLKKGSAAALATSAAARDGGYYVREKERERVACGLSRVSEIRLSIGINLLTVYLYLT